MSKETANEQMQDPSAVGKAEALFDQRLRQACIRAGDTDDRGRMDKAAFACWMEGNIRRHEVKQEKKWLWRSIVVAAFLCVFLCVGVLAMVPDKAETVAKPRKGTVTERDGDMVIGGNSEENVGNNVTTYASLEEIPKRLKEDLLFFSYVPFDLALKEIEIRQIKEENEYRAISYVYGDGEVVIKIKNGIDEKYFDVSIVNHYEKKYEISGLKIYELHKKGKFFYGFYHMNQVITISSEEKISKKEIEAMIASIRTDLNKW